jgi:molybdopterin synthase catalytic subunit
MPLLDVTLSPLEPGTLVLEVLAEADRRGQASGRCGAVATFLGTVRGENAGRRVLRLEYEGYEPLARRAFERIAAEAIERWPQTTIGLHHRLGTLGVGQVSVVIVAASPHRADAFAVCRYAIERVKQIVPIWKRETFDGGEEWIEGATADPDDEAAKEEALRRACA